MNASALAACSTCSARAHTDVRQGVDATLIEHERTLAKQLNDKAQQLAQATKPERAASLTQEVGQLETDLERAQIAIRNANPHYAALVQPQPLKFREIQAQLDPDTLLLEYALGEDRSYLWAITKDSVTSHELPKEALIKQSALQVYILLTARSTRERGETTQQRQRRISQAEAQLPAAAHPSATRCSRPSPLSLVTNGWSSSPMAHCNTSLLRCFQSRQ